MVHNNTRSVLLFIRLLLSLNLLVAHQHSANGQIPEQRHRQHRTAACAQPVNDNMLPVRMTRAAPFQRRGQHRIEVTSRIVER